MHVIVGTNKVGSFRGAIDFHRQYGQHVDVILVRNNRDGLEEFGESKLSPNWTATIDIPHLPPGLHAYRLSRAELLLGILRNPTPGYAKASAMIAQWLLEIAEVEYIYSVFSDSVIQELEELSSGAPEGYQYALTSLKGVEDDNLSANVAMDKAQHAFWAASPDSEGPAFLMAASQLWRAEKAHLGHC